MNAIRYYGFVIKSFKDADLKQFWETGKSRRIPANLRTVTGRKLAWLNAASNFEYLRVPPSNHFEALKGDREGQYSIRINDQFRLCFEWRGTHAHDVEMVDYH
jgi:proteic killer suppression protein